MIECTFGEFHNLSHWYDVVMKISQKIVKVVVLCIVAISGLFAGGAFVATQPAYATAPFPYEQDGREHPVTSDPGSLLAQTTIKSPLFERYLEIFGLNYSDNGTWKAIFFVQKLINYVLGILGFITLVIILYSFYMILFAANSETAIANARKTVVWAAIALALIWVSMYIVNFLFYVYNKWV